MYIVSRSSSAVAEVQLLPKPAPTSRPSTKPSTATTAEYSVPLPSPKDACVDKDAAASDIERTAYGISFAVNENLSVSYGVSDTDFESSTSDEENEGISASYTAGGATIGFVHNTKDNAGGTANADHETTELKLTFAF